VIVVGGKRGESSHIAGQEGFFVVAGVPSGQQALIVTKEGFVPTRHVVDLKSGAVEKLSLTLQHQATPLSPAQFQLRSTAPRPGPHNQAP